MIYGLNEDGGKNISFKRLIIRSENSDIFLAEYFNFVLKKTGELISGSNEVRSLKNPYFHYCQLLAEFRESLFEVSFVSSDRVAAGRRLKVDLILMLMLDRFLCSPLEYVELGCVNALKTFEETLKESKCFPELLKQVRAFLAESQVALVAKVPSMWSVQAAEPEPEHEKVSIGQHMR